MVIRKQNHHELGHIKYVTFSHAQHAEVLEHAVCSLNTHRDVRLVDSPRRVNLRVRIGVGLDIGGILLAVVLVKVL